MSHPNMPKPPFSCTFTPNLAEFLFQLKCTIAISTYQAGKVIFLSALDTNRISQLPRNFKKAMGMAVNGDQLAVATQDELIVLANAKAIAPNYPPKPNVYDGLYVPRAVYFTGEIDLHDMAWGDEGLWAVNTRFSCLSLINDKFSFEPKWKPDFITDLVPTDRCHLNGLAMLEGKPKYVSALGNTDKAKGWRENILSRGIIMDVDSGEVICSGLPMPHSPRIYDGKLYVLCSASGELVTVDTQSGKYEVVSKLPGFVRGMTKIGDYVFIGLSKLRKNASVFRDLPIAEKSIFSGVYVVHLPTGHHVGYIQYEASVEEIYDVQIIPCRHPGIMGHETPEHRMALVTPTDSFWKGNDEPEQGSDLPGSKVTLDA